MTDAAGQALSILRDGSQFQWYVIPIFAFVVYVYAVEIERRRWDLVLAGLAFWGMDWFNEIWNSLFFHVNGRAPMWGAPGDTAYLILIGLNIEIMFMFAVAGIVFCKMLPDDPKLRILGVPNRIFFAIVNSVFCVVVEIWLNHVGALTWDWSFWNARAPWLIIVFGYLTFFLVSYWVFDMKTVRSRLLTVGAIWAVDAAALVVFGAGLGWL